MSVVASGHCAAFYQWRKNTDTSAARLLPVHHAGDHSRRQRAKFDVVAATQGNITRPRKRTLTVNFRAFASKRSPRMPTQSNRLQCWTGQATFVSSQCTAPVGFYQWRKETLNN